MDWGYRQTDYDTSTPRTAAADTRVRREMAGVVTEPVTGADSTLDIGDFGDSEQDMLREDKVVVDKTVVPKERVRLEKETVVDEQVVSDEVRKERIASEGDVNTTRDNLNNPPR
jgi:stress response protein YsnF